jgi:hypothetical protein
MMFLGEAPRDWEEEEETKGKGKPPSGMSVT